MAVLTWPHNRVEQLKKLWEAGLSARQIAAELGNISRNAVIGKVHRLGLSGRGKSLSSAAFLRRKAHPAQHERTAESHRPALMQRSLKNLRVRYPLLFTGILLTTDAVIVLTQLAKGIGVDRSVSEISVLPQHLEKE